MCATQVLLMRVGPLRSDMKGTELSPANILIPLNFFFYLLRLRRYKAKCVKTRCLQEGGWSLGAKISGGRGRLWGIFLGVYKTRHILLSNSANCTGLLAVVLTQYRRVTDGWTDGQTDGIAIASTALAMRALLLAMRALRSAVKTKNC